MKWIPVKDRLPEVSKMVYEGSKWMQPIGFADYFLLSDWVLVTADADSSDGDDTEIFVAQYEDDLDGRTYWTTIGAGLLNNVTAWMPLPQPYKADRKTNSSEKPNNSTISKMEQVETMSCAECKHRPIGAEICEEPCHYEPQTDWHYDEQDATWYPYKHEDEPQQKSCATCKHALGNWDGESNNCGRCCGADRRFYEPKDEPQTERSNNADHIE
jgi:hypothetical protein